MKNPINDPEQPPVNILTNFFANFRLGSLLFRKKNRLPAYLIHSLTERCNAKCTHCFVIKNKPKPELTAEEIEAFCHSTAGSLYHVGLSGGEPFLRTDILRIANAYYEKAGVKVIRFSTNGYQVDHILRVTEEILNLPSRKSLVVEISLDGIGVEHDKIRKLAGSFSNAIRCYRGLSELTKKYRKFSVNVNVTVCKSNDDRLLELYGYLRKELGIKNISMTLTRGKPDQAEERGVDISKYEAFAGAVEKDLRLGNLVGFSGITNGLLVDAQNILCRRRIIRTLREKKFISRCYAGNLSGVLLSDGKVMPCELRPEVFGNIRERAFPDLWRSGEAKKFERVCDTCFCTHECFIGPNIIFNGRYTIQVFLVAAYLGAARGISNFNRRFLRIRTGA